MTARTEKKKLERREKSKTNRGDCEEVRHRYAETQSFSENRRRHANTAKHVASDKRKSQKKQSAKIKTVTGMLQQINPFLNSKEHPRMQSQNRLAHRARRGHLGTFVLKPAERHLQ